MKTDRHTMVLTEEQRGQLEALIRSRTVAQQTAVRCRIVLLAVQGASNTLGIQRAVHRTGCLLASCASTEPVGALPMPVAASASPSNRCCN